MNDSVHERRTELLGAYVLGHLTGPELRAVRDHLDSCGDCQDTVTELTPVARALAGVNADNVTAPAHLEESVLRRLDGRRRQRIRTRILLTAASALVVAGTSWWLLRPSAPLEPVALARQAPGVTAEAAIVPHTWGVEIKLDGRGFVSGQTYRVAVTSTDGGEVSAGSFIGTGENLLRCNLNSSVLRASAAGFVVRDETGAVALSSTFPRS
ncbi:anti-sigma factor family protein [Lentzea sp. NPDC102401]|uniref:anti-sigma factor family protein n=1 Tax=Lentzea sp. NPDC102401 TaxID=3364128 RepID=UPI003805EAD1